MILVVTNELDLRFLLMHQGKTLQSVRTATDALRVLRNGTSQLEGVILDHRVTNSKLVAGYVRTHVPGLTLVSWQLAMRSSPFSTVPREAGDMLPIDRGIEDSTRYIWDRSQAIR
ncbi:MAG TPA: hypothetical protein VK464_03315 [Symbiobacteriaceae bacterium]|jgi:hypothetical protein|nr:hypothetical protein [Symbiobacteriaceae bacterium]